MPDTAPAINSSAPVSGRCLTIQSPRTKKRKPKTFVDFGGSRRSGFKVLRCVDMMRSLTILVIHEASVRRHMHGTGDGLREIIHSLRTKMEQYPTSIQPAFGETLLEANADILMGIYHSPIFSGETANWEPIPGCAMDEAPAAILADWQWRKAQRAFSTPGGHHVDGPYFAVMVVERVSRQVLRLLVMPVWLCRSHTRMLPVRSGLERVLFDEVAHLGLSAVPGLSRVQLRQLERDLGSWFYGSLGTWPYLPDLILLHPTKRIFAIIELFGVKTILRYAKGVRRKERINADALRTHDIVAMEIDVREKKKKQEREDYIRSEARSLLLRYGFLEALGDFVPTAAR